MVVFVLFILAVGFVFSELLQYGPSAFVFAAVIAIGMSLVSYYSGDRIALWTSGAVPVDAKAQPYVYRMVENLCITAGVPAPKIYIIPDPAMNAFATGRDPKHASIAFTTGIIENLENEELEGVAAHELSHVKNYDTRLMMIVIICVGLVGLLTDFFLRWSFFGGHSRRDDRSVPQLGAILAIVGLVLAILSPIIAKLIQLAISRRREFLADASGALLTRYPEGLAKALEKIAQQDQAIRRPNTATAHLYIANPFGSMRSFTHLFSTHPPIKLRIEALRGMAS